MRKPLIVGLNNPHSTNPRAALLPWPVGSAGHRLFVMSGYSWKEYWEKFERVNACNILPDQSEWKRLGSRSVIILGRGTAHLISRLLPVPRNFFEWTRSISWSSNIVVVPHPSGLSRSYNDPAVRERLRELLQGDLR